MARKKNTGDNGEEQKFEAPGTVTKTTEGSHELIHYGDGTARERPIVNASGQYPPRPDADEGERE